MNRNFTIFIFVICSILALVFSAPTATAIPNFNDVEVNATSTNGTTTTSISSTTTTTKSITTTTTTTTTTPSTTKIATTTTTTVAPTTTTTITTTIITTTTKVPVITSTIAPTTTTKKPKKSSFSLGSFIGGMFLAAAPTFIAFAAYTFYKKRTTSYNRMPQNMS
ncbi:hypothetical protein SNEBB_009757 [Seison nebaliae]|nr:hypothetical protein SNEBB_009757 [Seison nebaliae]